jgi:hypothetical protein
MSYVLQSPRAYRTTRWKRRQAKQRRADRAASDTCINGCGPARFGRRCDVCAVKHIGRHLQLPSHRAHLTALRLVRELKEIARV